MAAGRTFPSRAALSFAIVLLCGILLQGSCDEVSPDTSLRRSTSEFAASVYKQLVCGNHGNLVFSPLSLYVTLSMTLLGSGGISKEELESVLIVAPSQNVHAQLRSTMASLLTDGNNASINTANAVYFDPGLLTVSDSYAQNCSQFYGDTLRQLQRPGAEQEVNSWVNATTRGAIPQLLASGDVGDDVAVLLVSAMFFEAEWNDMFYEGFTAQANFTTLDGRIVKVPTMANQAAYAVKVLKRLNVTVLELPYKGERFSLFLFLPKQGQELPTFEKALSGQILEEAVANMPATKMHIISVPKFELKVQKNLVQDFKSLGLTSMFDPLSANFLPMMQYPVQGLLYVSSVTHEALIEVSESGTRAAAATTLGISARSLPKIVRVNRPFLFILRDKVEGQNLFMGRVTDPTAIST